MTPTDARSSRRGSPRGPAPRASLVACLAALALAAGCGGQGPGATGGTDGKGGGGGGGVSGSHVSVQVVGPDGTPLVGAIGNADGTSTFTDGAGNLNLDAPGGVVTVRKTGFQPLTVQLASAPPNPWRMATASAPVNLIWDGRWGQLTAMEGLKSHLVGAGYAVSTLSAGALPAADEVVLAVPRHVSDGGRQELANYVQNGGKLVLVGDWGGFPDLDLAGLNALAHPAGISFDTVSLRDYQAQGTRPEWIALAQLAFPQLATGVGTVRFFTSNRLLLDGSQPAVPLARTAPSVAAVGGDRWTAGAQVVVAAGTAGRGQVLAVADASWLSDDDSAGIGTPDWQADGNAKLAQNLIAW